MAEVKVTNRRDDLLFAAASEFLVNGYAGASFSSIAKRLDLTKGSLAFHFKTKHSIAEGLSDVIHSGFEQAHWTTKLLNPKGGLRSLIIFMLLVGYLNEQDARFAAGARLCFDPSAPDDAVHETLQLWKQHIAGFVHEAVSNDELGAKWPADACAEYLLVLSIGISVASPRLELPTNTERLRFFRIALESLGATDADAIIDAAISAVSTVGSVPQSMHYASSDE